MRDAELVASIVAGDPDGLATAYGRYADPLFTYCRTILPDPADAADAVQDTFVLAASKIASLRDPERFRSWLYAIARNESLRQLRERKQTSALDEVPDLADDSVDVSEDAARAERSRLVREALPGLNASEREVIELQLRHQLEPAEMASVLGVSRNHVHSMLSRAREQLEVCLAVLVVGKTGRDDCPDLANMLSDWDGQLTVLLRKRVSRHIQHCPICTSRRAFALQPAAFFAPGGLALAMLAAPAVLKEEVFRLGLGTGAATVAHRAAITAKAGSFGSHGFPSPVRPARAGHHAAFHRTPRGQATAAGAVVATAAAAVVLLAFTGHSGHVKATEAGPSAAPPSPASAAVPSSGTTAPAGTSSPPAATAAPATGTITVSPASIVLSPLLGGSFTITAHGGAVSWSVAVPSSLIGSVTLSQSSGTVSPGSPVTVVVTTSLASLDSQITVYPGGEQVTILLGLL
jgi:RNA polymerase sigma factor (sigma-70 family)